MITQGKWEVSGNARNIIRADGNLRVADVYGSGSENTRTNARLIAAAPDLLEACKTAVKLYETDKSVGIGAGHFSSKVINWPEFWETVEKLIDKAEKS